MKKKRNIKRRRLQLQGTDENIKNLYLHKAQQKLEEWLQVTSDTIRKRTDQWLWIVSQDQKWLKQQSNEIKEAVIGVGVAIEKKSDVDKYKIVNVVRAFWQEEV